ncbi:MAG: DUF1838 family protein [Rhodobacteraceae bacterium]|nr:DUF1838 family protein [Paracoccaceae bacterium]
MPTKRVSFLAATALLMLSLTGAAARDLDLSKPEDGILASNKIACGSLKEGFIGHATWRGRVYSRVTWEQDRYLFDVVGYNVRRCPKVTDPKRGTGYRVVSREIMLYLKPGTDEVLKTWDNPFTGETVEVMPVKNDPVNLPPVMPIGRDGKPYRFSGEIIGDLVVRNLPASLYYPIPIGSKYPAAVGGYAQAMEIYTHFIPKDQLLTDSEEPLEGLHLAWHRFGKWMPWMKMGDRPGFLIFTTYGWRVGSPDELPAPIKNALATDEFALFRAPPPPDDPRPMMDEYTQYGAEMDAAGRSMGGK